MSPVWRIKAQPLQSLFVGKMTKANNQSCSQSHAIVVRLHVRKINVVILTPETAGTFLFEEQAIFSVGFSMQDEGMDVARSAPRGGGLTTTWMLFTYSLNRE